MTKPTPEIEALAAERLAADEDADHRAGRSAGSRCRCARRWREFWKHPSPWLIATFLVGSIVARVVVGGGSWWELVIPAALIALFPVIEWCVHVAILHWRPRSLGPVTIDSLLARDHRAHHADPRDLPLVFIPWKALVWLLPAYVAIAWLAMPTAASALSLLVSVYGVMFGYEWTHYLVHSDYRPKSRWYRSVWRNHRLHHYKNEHYWFTVTSCRDGGPAVRHLPRRPVRGEDVTDRQAAARARGVARLSDTGERWSVPPTRSADQRGLDLRGSPDRLAARSAAVGLFRPSHQRQAAVTTIAPTMDPMRPLGLRSRPSPDSRLASNPPTNEPERPAMNAIAQSMLPDFRPRISWAAAPAIMPNRMMARMSTHGA